MAKISDNGLAFIKGYETLKLKAYMPTPDDVWTIGYGHTRGVSNGLTCTEAQALVWLDEDCDEAETAVSAVPAILTQNQYDALVSLVFNIGTSAFATSTIRRMLVAGDYEGAAGQFKRWNKQKGKVLNGLTRRRGEEEQMFREGNP